MSDARPDDPRATLDHSIQLNQAYMSLYVASVRLRRAKEDLNFAEQEHDLAVAALNLLERQRV